MDSQYKNGNWSWDDEHNCLVFISYDITSKVATAVTVAKQTPNKQAFPSSIRFKETVDNMEKIQFRRYFQRRIKPPDPEVITLQDIKDVALFLANPKDLSAEFINYFHIPEVDRFLKAAIVYFHYYTQIWDEMILRREEAKRKLRQPIVTELEDIVRDNISDVRSMLAREYLALILGVGKSHQFHHLTSSTNSLSEKDRRLFEALICMAVRVVWVALQRKYLALIDLELNRITRTDFFNLVLHRGGKLSKSVWRSNSENRILEGTSNYKETKLKQRSALAKEVIYGEHDCRMLGLGFKDFVPVDNRITYLEKIYASPEELLWENGVTFGLVGIPREEYDCMMYPRERTSKNFDKEILQPTYYKFPPRIPIPDPEMPEEFPKSPCKWSESKQTIEARRHQCQVWRNFLLRRHQMVRSTSLPGSVENVHLQL